MSEVLFLCERDLIESFSNLTKIPNIYMTFPGHTVSNVQGMDGHETPEREKVDWLSEYAKIQGREDLCAG